MKFGKQIQKRQLDLPEYQAFFVNYKALKKLIKQLSITPTLEAHETRSQSQQAGDAQGALQANKATFFFRLERELEKVNGCYLQKEAELKLRLSTLQEKKKSIKARLTLTTRSSAGFVTLEGSYQQFGNDLNKLQQYVEINATAFSKILKKWDKSSKSRTKELYLSRAVEVQPCFNREVIADLSDRATTDSLELADWSEGQIVDLISGIETIPTHASLQYVADSEANSHLVEAAKTGNLSRLRELLARLGLAGIGRLRATRSFYYAISESPDESLRPFLESGLLDFSYHDGVNGRNCLHEAAIYGRETVLKACIEGGAEPASQDMYGRTPLHYACTFGRMMMIEPLLLACIAVIDLPDHDNYTPLVHAVAHEHVSCVEQLISRGAKVEPSTEVEHVPLNLACQHGSIPIVRLLLQKKAALLPDAEGLYPQHQVARSGRAPQLLSILQDHGADLDEPDKGNQWTPLFYAASEGHEEVVQILLRLGVNVDKKDDRGKQSMFYAAWEGHTSITQILSNVTDGNRTTRGQTSSEAVSRSTKSTKQDPDAIPDLALPPPIIPMRRYGHNYLESTSFVQLQFVGDGSSAIRFFNRRKYPAARMTISSRSFDLIPRTLTLPLTEDTRTISFQVERIDDLNLDFEMYPTFGTKVMAKSIALAGVFKGSSIARGQCSLPLFDTRLRAVGQIDLCYQIIHPLQGQSLEITEFATYWKATSHLDTQASTLITGSSLLGAYEQVRVHMTRDRIPVIHSSSHVSIGPVRIAINSLSCADFMQILGSSQSSSLASGVQSQEERSSQEESIALKLSEKLKATPPTTQLWLDIAEPAMLSEINVNDYANAILSDIFEQSKSRRQSGTEGRRSIVITCRSVELCLGLNWKQPNCECIPNAEIVSGELMMNYRPRILEHQLQWEDQGPHFQRGQGSSSA